MRLTRLIVERFGSVRNARVEFGRGLNVLYGPNDLGKSTLAQAIRAALLLPPGSSAHEDFVEWGTDETPKVELVFQAGPADRYWRIRKEFGSGSSAKATLHGSADGQTWTQEAKGRKVDGEVRRLLAWGIPEPGGRGGTRGLPESFLTAVLLAQQTDPSGIFDASIEADADESGKKLLTHALQALAQDPLLKLALDAAQRRIDEAFTATGRRKTGRGSPFKDAADAIASAIHEHEQRVEELNKTREVESGIEALHEERRSAEEQREEAAAELRRLEQDSQRQAARRALAAQLAEAREALAGLERIRQQVAEAEANEALREREMRRADEQAARAEAGRAAAEQRLTEAREELRRLQGGDAARERELAQKTLEKELLELQAKSASAADLARRARAARDAERAVAEARKQIATLEERVGALRAEVAALEAHREEAEHLRDQLSGLALYELLGRAQAEADEARAARGEAVKLRKQIARIEKRDDGDGHPTLPSPDELSKLRKLNQQCIEAEARLGGGLSATVRVTRPLDIEVTLDGAPAKMIRSVKQRRSFDADAAMTLDLGGLAQIELSAGEADARGKAEKLRARWEKTGAPVLKAAGVRSFARLEDACREAEDARRESADVARQIQELARRAEELDRLAAQADEAADRVKSRRKALEPYDMDALQLLAAKLGPDREADVERLRRQAGEQASQAGAKRDAATRELVGLEADLRSRSSALAAAESLRATAADDLSGEAWAAVLQRATADAASLEERRAQAARKIEALASDGGDAIGRATTAVEGAEGAFRQALATARAAGGAKDAALQALADARGVLRTRRERADALDFEAPRQAVLQREAELAAAPAPDPEVTDEDLADARERLDRAARLADDRQGQVQKLLGALEHVGGDVAHERERLAAEAVARAREREAALDLDYGAWRLLHDTLREVESEESVHLGRALVQPIGERFARLTEGRYGAIDVEPGLKTRGIQAGGETREIKALSAGLRDQLATLFRLSVAEHLESLLVLDDQLAQTDPQRVDWFGRVLRDCAERIQIVLLTCRPREFLGEDEVASPGAPVMDSASGLLRAVDLEQVVERAPLDAG